MQDYKKDGSKAKNSKTSTKKDPYTPGYLIVSLQTLVRCIKQTHQLLQKYAHLQELQMLTTAKCFATRSIERWAGNVLYKVTKRKCCICIVCFSGPIRGRRREEGSKEGERQRMCGGGGKDWGGGGKDWGRGRQTYGEEGAKVLNEINELHVLKSYS